MSFSHFPPGVCSETPALPDSAIRLIQKIDENATYEVLWDFVVEMKDELVKLAWNFNKNSIIRAFEDHSDGLRRLFYTIHRDVLRSLVQQTLAHDFRDLHSPNWEFVYSAKGPGTYAATYGILDADRITVRNGLTGREIKTLVRYLERYGHGCKAWIAQGGSDGAGTSQLTQHQRDALHFTAEIDGIFPMYNEQAGESDDEEEDEADDQNPIANLVNEQTEYDTDSSSGSDTSIGVRRFRRPRFAAGRTKETPFDMMVHIIQMVSMFRFRYRNTLDRDVEQLQAPMCIGNANDIERRKQAYRISGGMAGSAKLYGLTMSCLHKMDLRPFEVFVPVIKAWDAESINLGEILVTVLAGSAVSASESGGFNVHPPGLKPSGRLPTQLAFLQNYDEVCKKLWCEKNLLATRDDSFAKKRSKMFTELMRATDAQLVAATKRVEMAHAQLVSAGNKRDNYNAEVEANLAELSKLKDDLLKSAEQWESGVGRWLHKDSSLAPSSQLDAIDDGAIFAGIINDTD